MKTMSATLASKEFGRFIDAAQREPILLTKKDRPVAVTVSVADWEELISPVSYTHLTLPTNREV